MAGYLIKRLAVGILAMWLLVTAAFFLTRMMPGTPFDSGNVSETVLLKMEEEYGLDRPVSRQYIQYLGNLLKGDLGISYKKPGIMVSEVIKRAFPVTLSIGAPALLLAFLLGVSGGAMRAFSRHKWIRGLFGGLTAAGSSMPNFITAMLFSLVFGVIFQWFPVSGLLSPVHYVLPVLSLALYPSSVFAGLAYTSCREVMEEDYILLVKTKGLKKRKMAAHVLKNALLSSVTYLGPAASLLLTGSFAVESIFTIPGLGREFVNSIANRDYTMIMGLTIFMGIMVWAIQIVSDLLCMALDPRIRKSVNQEKER